MALHGQLTAETLADLLQVLALGRRQGTLRVRDGRRTRVLRIADAHVQLLSTDSGNGLRIGKLLVRRGHLTSRQLKEAVRRQESTASLLGEVLVQLGWVTQEHVDEVVRAQIEEEIHDLFLWRDATFEFDEQAGEPLEASEARLRGVEMDISHVLVEAMRRRDEWPMVRSGIPGSGAIFRWVTPEAGDRARETSQVAVRLLAESIDGTHSVRDLVDCSPLGRFHVWRILAGWRASEWLMEVPSEEAARIARRAEGRGDRETASRLWGAAVRRSGPLAPPEWVEALSRHTHESQSDAEEPWGEGTSPRPEAPEVVHRDLFAAAIDSGDRVAALEQGRAIIDKAVSESDDASALHVADRLTQAFPQDLEVGVFLAHTLPVLARKAGSRREIGRIQRRLREKAARPASGAKAAPRATILVADDDMLCRHYVRAWMEEAGYRVLECKSGAEAVLRAREALPSVIMLDVMMSGVDGIEACRRLKRDPVTRPIPVILVTARNRAKDVAAAAQAGADAYIVKPCSPDLILRRVSSALSGDPPPADPARERRAPEGDGPLDAGVLSRLRTVGSGSLVRRLAGMFLDSAPDRIQAANSDDLKSVEAAAHSLVSSAGNLGARRIQEVAERLERAARDREHALVRSLRDDLARAYEDARPAVERLAAGGRIEP